MSRRRARLLLAAGVLAAAGAAVAVLAFSRGGDGRVPDRVWRRAAVPGATRGAVERAFGGPGQPAGLRSSPEPGCLELVLAPGRPTGNHVPAGLLTGPGVAARVWPAEGAEAADRYYLVSFRDGAVQETTLFGWGSPPPPDWRDQWDRLRRRVGW